VGEALVSVEDLNAEPSVWYGMAEGHHWLGDKERLELALKACDLYLKKVEFLEEELIRARTEHRRR